MRIGVALVDGVSGSPDRPGHCIEMLGLRGWSDDPDHISLLTVNSTLAGSIDLPACHARIEIVAQGRGSELVREVFWTLTVAAALLLGRRQRILLHAGAFVSPNGMAWLLVGGTHSGKSSTCANLIRAGWGYLADDQVVIGAGPGDGLWVEGLLRAFRLDDGFEAGTCTGLRSHADPTRLGAGTWHQTAPLGGILFPRIEPDGRSAVIPLRSSDALQELIRQSPWLLADRAAAPGILMRMLQMGGLPTYGLSLGRDVYVNPAALAGLLESTVTAGRLELPVLGPAPLMANRIDHGRRVP